MLRTFKEVDDVVRRTGRAERTEDPMPHTLSDVLILLALPTFYQLVHNLGVRWRSRRGGSP